jgi:SAM-dependent methyltransferase
VDADLSNSIGAAHERFVPGTADGELIEADHMARYLWATQLAAGCAVLDAGCGVGYGTALLARAGATDAVGIDVSRDSVEAARTGAPDNASFVVGDVHELPFEDGRFGLVVCFEVIEHVEEQDTVLAELARVLAPDGVLALSSPHRGVYPEGNPHHLHEYVPEELRAALGALFPHVELRRQHPWVASAVLDDEQVADGSLRARDDVVVSRSAPVAPGTEPYTVALASRQPLPSPPGRVVLAGAVDLSLKSKLAHAAAVNAALTLERDTLRNDLAALAAIEDRLRANNATLLASLDEARVVLETRDAELEARRAEMHNIYTSASWRATKPLRAIQRWRR